jgi:hypothetical protein
MLLCSSSVLVSGSANLSMRTLHIIILLTATLAVHAQDWQWSKHIGGPGRDAASVAGVDGEDNLYLIGGYARPMSPWTFQDCYFDEDTIPGSNDAFIAKYDGSGVGLWLRLLTSPGFAGIGPLILDTANGVFYTLGTFHGSCTLDTITVTAPGGAGVLLAKWDLDGNCIWARTIASSWLVDGTWGVSGHGLVMDGGGELLVSLRTSPFGMSQVEGEDLPPGTFLGKYDNDGQALWWKPFTLFGGFQKEVFLYDLRHRGDRIYGYGRAMISQAGDTTTVDTIQIVGRQGQGFVLVGLDPATGVAEWFRLEGFPNGASGFNRMAIDSLGGIVVVGSYSGTDGTAVFGEDTLSSITSYSKGFIAKYVTDGSFQFVREFHGSNTFFFYGADVAPDGHMALTGQLRGEITLGGTTYTANAFSDLFVAVHDPDGEPLGFMHATGGTGRSIRFLGSDLVLTGQFPSGTTTPTGSITIGGETYTSHGYADIVLARTSLPTSIAPKSMGDDRLLIYANPNQGSFRLVVPEAVRHARDLVLRVYDGTGRLLQQQKLDMGEERPKVDLFGVSPGFYMVTLGNGQRTYSGMVVVE